MMLIYGACAYNVKNWQGTMLLVIEFSLSQSNENFITIYNHLKNLQPSLLSEQPLSEQFIHIISSM